MVVEIVLWIVRRSPVLKGSAIMMVNTISVCSADTRNEKIYILRVFIYLGTEECTFEIRDGLGSDTGKISKKTNVNYDNNKNSIVILNSASQSLQQMLTVSMKIKLHYNEFSFSPS